MAVRAITPTCSDNGRTFSLAASGMKADEINTFEANRRTQYQQLHADVGNMTASYQVGYDYAISRPKRHRSARVRSEPTHNCNFRLALAC